MINKFQWHKKGHLFVLEKEGFTHSSHPCIVQIKKDKFILAFSSRDSNNRSHIFFCKAEVRNSKIKIIGKPSLALGLGKPGNFDCDGVLSCCFVKTEDYYYLYYSGWQNFPGGFWLCDTGRAIVDIENLSAEREFDGPVLARDIDNPLFAAATSIQVNNEGKWHTWYISGLKWEKTDNGWKVLESVRHAESFDGIDWVCDSGHCLTPLDNYEYSFGRPCVVSGDNCFYMWFGHRETENISTYRIGFALSKDGLNWSRDDSSAGIDVSQEGWDSEMITYPCVFEHQSILYLLYNGNSYGKTGFGYAVME